jgi:ubiquinone/menaquinone biosynthesis C-methylase UbiE
MTQTVKRLLHPGCGGEPLPFWLEGYEETRLDIDAQWMPDILADIMDMGNIGQFDLIYTCHTLEHVYPHEVKVVLSEFKRVLKDGCAAIIFVPDLEDVKANHDILYETAFGPICGLDLIYGSAWLIENVSKYMSHHTGFIKETLEAALNEAGFSKVEVKRVGDHNLMGVAIK